MSQDQRQRDFELKARQAELALASASTQKAALDAAINAAENYFNAFRHAAAQLDKKRLDARCNELLTRAEEIKKATRWPPPAPSPSPSPAASPAKQPQGQCFASRSKEPQSTRRLSKREQIILLESSKLHGFVFPPWTGDPEGQEFEAPLGGAQLYADEKELALSGEQLEMFDGWARPEVALGEPTMRAERPLDLVQDVTTDCSVIASLCALEAHCARWPREEFAKYFINFYPRDPSTGLPTLSKSGKYILRLYFNGCHRKVVIDDRLPTSRHQHGALHVVDRNNPGLLWPSLVEKAYLKCRGGYDFPGSNSGTDLWVLTGWIPEQIFLHDEETSLDETWRLVYGAYRFGDVFVTIGTGELTERVERETGLVGLHDYAVLEMRERDGRRQLLVKNPWALGTVWQGISSGYDGDDRPSLPGAAGDSVEESMAGLNISGNDESAAKTLAPGTFWMDFERVFQDFENMYLNWNPTLFSYREDLHFNWDMSKENDIDVPGSFVTNPQFAVTTKGEDASSTQLTPVWLLLSRHFRSEDYFSSHSQNQEDGPGFISIYVFEKTNGKRVHLSDGCFRRGPFVNSPNTLMRLEVPANASYTVVPSEYGLRKIAHNFTLSVLSRVPVSLAHAESKYGHTMRFDSAWTLSTAGGNTESPRYPSNPQFSLDIPHPCSIAVFLETSTVDLAANIKILWSNSAANRSRRITSIRTRDIVVDSGDYRRGCALAETENIPKGSFTLVCSTFKEDQLGRFTIWINTTKPCSARPLPAEGAGRLSIPCPLAVLRPGVNRILAPLQVTRLTRLKVIARRKQSTMVDSVTSTSRAAAPSPVLLSIEQGQRPFGEVLASSGDGSFDDAATGVRIEDVDLTPEMAGVGGLWLVVERLGAGSATTAIDGVEDVLEVEVLAEHRVETGEWKMAPEFTGI
ncbi:cysteine protease [Ascosphaera atra]|nr:cysteine protease [Ascosphaera atra]